MEKYNKKGKICIKLLILCITCLLSLSLFSNANAIEQIDSAYVTSATWEFAGTGISSTSQTKSVSGGNILRNIYFNPSSNEYQSMANLQIDLNRTISLSKTNKFKIDLIYLIQNDDSISANFATPVCPTGRGDYVIDDCIYEQVSFNYVITQWREYPYQTQTGTTEFDWGTYNQNNFKYYLIRIKGHYNKDNEQSVTNLRFFRTNFMVYNTSSITGYQELNTLNIIFSPVLVYKDEQTAEEEVADKELEDRDNLETQSTETNSDASSSSQDIGTATTSITGVISAFVGNLQNLNANNCTLPEITAYGFSLGQMNLCTFSPPSWIAGVTNVVVSLITLGLAYHLFRRIMGIAKSLAGGK